MNVTTFPNISISSPSLCPPQNPLKYFWFRARTNTVKNNIFRAENVMDCEFKRDICHIEKKTKWNIRIKFCDEILIIIT